MFRLKISPALLLVSALLGFHLLFTRHIVPFSAINVALLCAVPAGYIYPDKISYLMLALSWVVLYPLYCYHSAMGPLNTAVPLFLFSCLILVSIVYKNIVRREKVLWGRRLNERSVRRAKLSEDFEKAGRAEDLIKARELAIISLYEITKRMSEDLRFDDIFNAISVFLRDNFTFRKCDLLILGSRDDQTMVEREYTVWRAELAPRSAGRPDYNKLARMLMAGFSDIYISRAENSQIFDDLGIHDPAVESFIAIPLLSEKRMVGMLVVENIAKADVERLVILAIQFALEIKKVLLYEMVERLAITDSLTGLYVRRHFSERLEEELRRSKRYGFMFAFLMLDIDDFKRCNDTYGHLVGDVVLKDIARIIKDNVREIDIAGRYGGEEMALVLPETTRDSARVVADRLRRRIAEYVFKAYDEKLKISVSCGISIFPDDADDAKALVDKADEALYIAKKSGKNVVCEWKKGYNI